MKLNHECVRDVLLFCENSTALRSDLSWDYKTLNDFVKSLTQYPQEEIAYTLFLLNEAEYIDAIISKTDYYISHITVYRLTYKGHEFLDTIRSNTVWKKIQNSISSIGSVSLPVLQELGKHILVQSLFPS